jgi:hypothetical protein
MLTVARGQRGNFTNFSCPLVGYRFRFLRHIAAHVPSPGRFIRGIVGLFTILPVHCSTATAIAASSLRS